MDNTFVKKISDNLKGTGIDLKSKKICVCLSGGADSTALLNAAVRLKNEFSFSVSALHVNHLIRGEEAFRDERFCKELCERLETELIVKREDVPSIAAEMKKGLEETAREVRYGITDSLKDRFDYFLTAHNANDNAETVLFNIIRGCSVNGLCGIPAVRGSILRPMLNIERDEIMAFLNQIGCGYVVDSTNLSADYTRNYLRNEIIPSLKRINPEITSSLNRLSSLALENEEYFDDIVRKTKNLKSAPRPVRSRMIINGYKSFAKHSANEINPGNNITLTHIDSICDAIDKTESSIISLPHGIYATVENGNCSFCSSFPEKKSYGKTELCEGMNLFADGKVKIRLDTEKNERKNEKFNNLFILTTLNYGKIKGKLFARSRLPGDSFKCLNVTKNVKKEFISKKIACSIRNDIPVICDDEGIVFVPFIGAADRVYQKDRIVGDTLIVSVEFNNKGDAYNK